MEGDVGGQIGGATPLTQTFYDARNSATWWTMPAATQTPYSALFSFC